MCDLVAKMNCHETNDVKTKYDIKNIRTVNIIIKFLINFTEQNKCEILNIFVLNPLELISFHRHTKHKNCIWRE